MSNDLAASGLTLIVGFVAMATFMLLCLRIAVKQQKLTIVDTA